jgi:hypothetical protein
MVTISFEQLQIITVKGWPSYYLNTTPGGARGLWVKCKYEKDGGIYADVDYVRDVAAG